MKLSHTDQLGASVLPIWEQTVEVTRYTDGGYTKGRYTAGSSSTFDMAAVVQPLRGRAIEEVPENRRTSENIVIWSQVVLNVAEAPGGPQADRVTYEGESYEVHTQRKWSTLGGFYRAIANKIGQ